MEIQLWQSNDVRTYMQTTVELLTVNHCEEQIQLPVWHVFTPHDNYFDNEVIEQQMRVVFTDFYPAPLAAKTHSPSVVATKKEAAAFIPKQLRAALKASAKKRSQDRYLQRMSELKLLRFFTRKHHAIMVGILITGLQVFWVN